MPKTDDDKKELYPSFQREPDPFRLSQMLKEAMKWRWAVQHGRIDGPKASYFTFSQTVAQWELDAICAAMNAIYVIAKQPIRVYNSMGELKPGFESNNPEWNKSLTRPSSRTFRVG